MGLSDVLGPCSYGATVFLWHDGSDVDCPGGYIAAMPTGLRPIALATTLCVLAVACTSTDGNAESTGADQASTAEIEFVSTVSTRPEMVTGGDVLISAQSESVDSVAVDGEEVDVEFTSTDGVSTGLVTGLAEGESSIEVHADDETGTLDVINHPSNGPVFSGERIAMTVCTTDRFGLGESDPPECAAPDRVSHGYVDSDNRVQELDNLADIPDDAATVDIDGTAEPAVLRIERGVLNRAVYEIISLDTTGDLSEDFDSDHWNDRLVYRFGGGCGTTFGQGFMMMGAPSTALLADGYAFASSTLNTFQVQCNDILSAETTMVVKEHFVEQYGVPAVTIGSGGSGGAIQQILIAQNYPGLLDAIGPTVPFPDAASIAPGVTDCALMANYYDSDEGSGLDAEQQTAINGHLSPLTCLAWDETFVPNVDPAKCGLGERIGDTAKSIPGLEDGIPEPPQDQMYNPQTNPGGVRCTFQESYVNVYGTDAEGFANRPLDNFGVQYGLQALAGGKISFQEFMQLNENIGGMDIDANFVSDRMEASGQSMEATYLTGRVAQTDTPLNDVPIITVNIYTDPDGDIHDRFRMFSLNERLLSEDGEQAPNYVMWTKAKKPDSTLLDGFAGGAGIDTILTRTLDEWATAIKVDSSGESLAEKIANNAPGNAVNSCFDAEGELEESGSDVYEEPGPCSDPYPIMGDPRTVAGAPLSNDIGKCAVIPVSDAVDSLDYGTDLSEDQVAELERVFPGGVCDFTQTGVGQVQMETTWRSYD